MASDVPATFWDSAVSPLAASISEGTIQSYQTLATAVSHVMNEIKSTIPSHRDLFESKGEHNLVRQILDVLDQQKLLLEHKVEWIKNLEGWSANYKDWPSKSRSQRMHCFENRFYFEDSIELGEATFFHQAKEALHSVHNAVTSAEKVEEVLASAIRKWLMYVDMYREVDPRPRQDTADLISYQATQLEESAKKSQPNAAQQSVHDTAAQTLFRDQFYREYDLKEPLIQAKIAQGSQPSR